MIIKSKRLLKIISFNFASAMAIFPFILIKDSNMLKNSVLLNHEKIHLRQQLELLLVFFYLWYAIEYLIHFIRFRNRQEAYYNISFEKEAYCHESDLEYLKRRPLFAFFKFLA